MASSNEILNISEYVEDHIIPRFACKYLDCSSLSPINSSMKDFRDSLDYASAEIERIDMVVTQHMSTSWTFLCQLRQRIVHAKETGVKNAFSSIHESLTNLAQEIVDLDNFCRTHRVAFLKILNYYEPRMSTVVQESLHTKCRRSSFGSVQLNVFLIPMSECYSVLRDLCEVGSSCAELESNNIVEVVQPLNSESFASTDQSAGEESHTPADTVSASEHTEKTTECWVPPSSFKRKTNKYWVHNRDVLRLCLKIIQHLPILVFGKGEGLPEDLWTCKFSDLSKWEKSMQYAGQITSVYLDSASDFEYYHGRLARGEGALLYRLRWYKTLTCPDRIFLERKTHREGWGQEESIKERFSLPTHQLDAFMAGSFFPSEDSFLASDKDIPAQIALAREVQEQILNDKHSLVPASRTAYERTAFQLSTSNDVRISLDGNLWLHDEFGYMSSFEDSVRTSLDPNNGRSILFPHGVLEIKLAGEAPPWIDELLNDFQSSTVQVYKFSKYLSSIAIFHTDQVANIPHWFTEEGALTDAFGVGGQTLSSLEGSEEKKAMNKYTLFRTGTLLTEICNQDHAAANTLPEINSPSRCSWDRSKMLRQSDGCKYAVAVASVPLDVEDHAEESKHWDPELGELGRVACAEKDKTRTFLPGDARYRFRGLGDAKEPRPKVKKVPAPMVPARIEPKTFFANERTFIQWLTTAVLLTTLSLALLNYDTQPAYAAGLTIFPIAIFFILYALGTFLWRLRALKEKKNMSYHDTTGPVLLVIGLMGAIILTLIFVELDRRGWWDSANSTFELRVKNQRGFKISPQVSVGACELLVDTPAYPSFSQSSSALIDESESQIYIVSKTHLYTYSIGTQALEKIATFPNTDIEGAALSLPASTSPSLVIDTENFIYLASEAPNNEILEVSLIDGTETRRWKMPNSIFSSMSVLEGLAWDSKRELFWATAERHIYGLVLGECARDETGCSVSVVESIDTETYLTAEEDQIDSLSNPFKVGDLFYHKGADQLYILLDNLNVVKIVDLATGVVVGEHALPGLADQWEGISVSADQSTMWLSLNYPAQLWEFAFDPSSGFKNCARATKNYH